MPTTEVALFVILPIFFKVCFSIDELRKLAPKFPKFDEGDPNSRLRRTAR